MNEREERIGRNEAVFREFNEQIKRVDETFAVASHEPLPLICECGDSECTGRVEMASSAYEALRAHPARFVIIPGHDVPSVERVVERGEGYEIVEKHAGDARALAEETGPRS